MNGTEGGTSLPTASTNNRWSVVNNGGSNINKWTTIAGSGNRNNGGGNGLTYKNSSSNRWGGLTTSSSGNLKPFSSSASSQSSTTTNARLSNVPNPTSLKDEKWNLNNDGEGNKSLQKASTTNRWTGLGTSGNYKFFDSSILITNSSDLTVSVTENTNNSLPSNTSKPIEPPKDEKWNYVDPSGILRGPFLATQLQIWYKSGYFNSTLTLYRDGEQNSITLGNF